MFDQQATGSVSDCRVAKVELDAFLAGANSDVSIDHLFVDSAVRGLKVDMGSDLRGRDVVIENTTTESLLVSSNSNVKLNNSHILPAAGWAVRGYSYSGIQYVLDLTGNYWGTTDSEAIAGLIWDGNDDPGLHYTVQFVPFANGQVPTESTSWGSLKALFR
jgi:hypothetical protein